MLQKILDKLYDIAFWSIIGSIVFGLIVLWMCLWGAIRFF